MTTPGDGGGVVITLRDIYQLVVGLTARVDTALARGTQHDEQLGDHESRLRALERSRWPIASVTVLIALGSLVIAAVALYAKK